ncbi:hypothetical protein D4R89_02680 [bacterium]|nr:MAG: hypothetical protein D4R89_02680 [bacterium]
MREASMKAIVISALLILAWTGAFAQTPEPVFEELPGPGKICRIGDVYTFTYEFDKTPKMGMAILKVRLFDETGKRTTGLEITGRSDMPSMSGAHDSGEVPFKLNRKGDYLLPVNVVMPGEWQIRLVFSSNKEVIFRGSFKFDV